MKTTFAIWRELCDALGNMRAKEFGFYSAGQSFSFFFFFACNAEKDTHNNDDNSCCILFY
jgi:hypothetical protein